MHKLLPACMGLLLSLSACQSRDNSATIQAINKSLMESNEILTDNNLEVLQAMEARLRDPVTTAKAGLWSPPTLKVKDLTTAIIQYLDGLEQQVKALKDDDQSGVQQLFQQEEDRMYSKLVSYVKGIAGVLDSSMAKGYPMLQMQMAKDKESFKKEIADRFTIKVDSVGESRTVPDAWRTIYGKPATYSTAIALLNKLKHDVLVSTFDMSEYCLNHTNVLICGNFTKFSAIAVINSSVVKSGQIIEVTAGVGEFSAASKPTITINGDLANTDFEGIAVYSFKANGKPGKHIIPVKIKYFMPDGTQNIVTKKIQYTIAE